MIDRLDAFLPEDVISRWSPKRKQVETLHQKSVELEPDQIHHEVNEASTAVERVSSEKAAEVASPTKVIVIEDSPKKILEEEDVEIQEVSMPSEFLQQTLHKAQSQFEEPIFKCKRRHLRELRKLSAALESEFERTL